jgi:hypothetical protein
VKDRSFADQFRDFFGNAERGHFYCFHECSRQ